MPYPDIQIVEYIPTYRKGLWNLLLSVTSLSDENALSIRPGSAEKLMRSATSPNTHLAIATIGENVVGYTELHSIGRHSIHFHRAATHRDFRCRGVFTALLENVVSFAGNLFIEADINPKREHFKTMQRFDFEADTRPSREPGMISIVRPPRPYLTKFWKR